MSPRLLAVIAIAAIAGGIAWFALRDRGDAPPPGPIVAPAPTKPEPAAPPAPAPERTAVPTPQPSLPTTDRPTPALPKAPTPVDLYAHEQRDVEWAKETEREIEKKLAHLSGASLEETECHQTQCKLTLTSADEKGLGAALGVLQSPQGLVGLASSMMLTAPTKRADGTLALNAYATFER